MFDNTQANDEGWGLFKTDDGRLEIQRLDEGPFDEGDEPTGEPIFDSDDEAWDFVGLMALTGSD